MSFPIENFIAKPGQKVALDKIDPKATSYQKGSSRDDVKKRLKELNERLEELQNTLWAQKKHRVLLVLQAMDAGGKDGSIRKVFTGVNPAGVRVESFGRPSKAELSRDYLWRCHQVVPTDGEIVVFNRSHYEDVLAVRVLKLKPEEVWRKRYQHINDFERMLSDEGTTVVKVFLHISPTEQKRRLQRRLDEPTKNWKFKSADLEQRELWGKHQKAFAEAISQTSTERAPWYVVPADNKWYRDVVLSEIMVQTLESLNLVYPEPEEDLDGIKISDI